jgi:hypothetical protein
MTLTAGLFSEPLLEFGFGQKVEHPQDGLFLYGPVAARGRPASVHVGVIGSASGIALVREWLNRLAGPIAVRDPTQLHTSPWPGFQAALGARLVAEPLAAIILDAAAIDAAARKGNRTEAVRSTVRLFEEAILDHLRTEESRPDVWLVVIPEVVFSYGRPKVAAPADAASSTLIGERAARRILQEGSLFPEDEEQARTYLFARNFHHQLKCQLLHKEVVIQIVRETTLDPTLELDHFGRPKRSVQESAKIAWNFATTLYFKARGQPWQLADVRPGVCYVGLVFKEDPSPAAQGEACCAAQMFLNSGNGVVFRGALGPWYSPKTREYHLSKAAAADLVGQIVKAYARDHGKPPSELFLHGRQRFSEEEWSGFQSTVPAETKLVGVRIRSSQDLRLFRPGSDRPVLRGTHVAVTRREGYLWTTGYTPRLRTYPGFETPKPMLVEISQGDGDILTVMRDVLALTKLNYNACDYASGLPVTLKFADRVGDILTASPQGKTAPPLPFRFYI